MMQEESQQKKFAPKPKLTKAERRELQERQRAAKAGKLSGSHGGQKQPKQTKAGKQDVHARKRFINRAQAQNTVSMFNHIAQYERGTSLSLKVGFSAADAALVHPTILNLGLKYAEQKLSGSNGRAVGMLLAFRRVIMDYKTPPGKALARDLDKAIKPLIQFLIDCRPHSITMGNAIKHIRHIIAKTSIDAAEEDTKRSLCDAIDRFIDTYIVFAQEEIAKHGVEKLATDDVILTYSYYTAVKKILIDGKKQGKRFTIYVVCARPRENESKRMLMELAAEGLRCVFINLSSLSYVMPKVTKVLLGASAFFSNGAALGSIGTASIALVARAFQKPVLFCAETYKFSEKVHLNGISYNEIADPDEILLPSTYGLDGVRKPDICSDWRDNPSLKLLNLTYDLTTMDQITGVITEVGLIPPTSVPVVVREQNEALESVGHAA